MTREYSIKLIVFRSIRVESENMKPKMKSYFWDDLSDDIMNLYVQ